MTVTNRPKLSPVLINVAGMDGWPPKCSRVDAFLPNFWQPYTSGKLVYILISVLVLVYVSTRSFGLCFRFAQSTCTK